MKKQDPIGLASFICAFILSYRIISSAFLIAYRDCVLYASDPSYPRHPCPILFLFYLIKS